MITVWHLETAKVIARTGGAQTRPEGLLFKRREAGFQPSSGDAGNSPKRSPPAGGRRQYIFCRCPGYMLVDGFAASSRILNEMISECGLFHAKKSGKHIAAVPTRKTKRGTKRFIFIS
jgi:hypothetical protein